MSTDSPSNNFRSSHPEQGEQGIEELVCGLDEQQCQQECEHKKDRRKCPFVTIKRKGLEELFRGYLSGNKLYGNTIDDCIDEIVCFINLYTGQKNVELYRLIRFVKNLEYMNGTKPEYAFTEQEIYESFKGKLSSPPPEGQDWKELYESACESYREAEKENDELEKQRDHYKALAEAAEEIINNLEYRRTNEGWVIKASDNMQSIVDKWKLAKQQTK